MTVDGKALAEKIKSELKPLGRVGLAIVIVGDDEASHVYVRAKIKAATQVGITAQSTELAKDTKEQDLIQTIEGLNKDKTVNAILIQLPLPRHIDTSRVLESIDPKKDVDGLHPINAGKLFQGGIPNFVPCTPLGIMEILKESKVDLVGKHAVVVGRSNIVGKPVALLLLDSGCTVTIAHSKTKNLKQHVKMADILVVAVGVPKLITKDMVKSGAVVIDVGINRTGDKLVGDVDFDNVKKVASVITPVPGGVGPMTITMVLKNALSNQSKML